MNVPSPRQPLPLHRGTPVSAGGRSDDLRLSDVWAGVVRNRWVILGCVVLALGAGHLYTLGQIPIYESAATIRIQERQLNISDVYHTLSTGIAGSDLGTEMEVLRSRALREDAVRVLGLRLRLVEPERVSRQEYIDRIAVAPDASPELYRLVRRPDRRFDVLAGEGDHLVAISGPDGMVELPKVSFGLTPAAVELEQLQIETESFTSAVDRVNGGLSVHQPRRDAYIVTVSYRSSDSLLTRDVPNLITTSYVAHRQNSQTAEARSAVKFLRAQLERVEAELSLAEDSFQSFQERADVLDPQVETSSEVARLIAKESERSSVQAEVEALTRSLAEIQGAADGNPNGPSSFRKLVGLPFLLRNPAASALLTALITAENDRAALVGSTAEDPDVEVLTAKIEDLERQLHSITTTYLAGLRNQVASLNGALAQFQRELDAIPGKQLQHARLSRRVKALEEVHALLQGKLNEAEIAEAAKDASVQLIDVATAPNWPSSPDPSFNQMVAVAMGLVAGLLLALVREYRDKSVHTRKDIAIATGVPVLALIPRIVRPAGRVALIAERPRLTSGNSSPHPEPPRVAGAPSSRTGYTFLTAVPSPAKDRVPAPAAGNGDAAASPRRRLTVSQRGRVVAEAYGMLQTNLAFAHSDPPVRCVVVTSPLAGDGKTTCATNLAITLALRGSKTLLIDADLRRGVIHAAFDVGRAPGMAEVLSRSLPVSDVVHTVTIGEEDDELHFITSGAPAANPSGLLENSFPALLATARERFDFVIIDSPPVNIMSDASLLGLHADGVLVVARSGYTQSSALAYATEQLTRLGVRVLGVVLNDIDFKREAGYDSAYRYYANEPEPSASRSS